MLPEDLYEIRIAVVSITSAAQLRGHYTSADLTRLEDLGERLAQIAEEELRSRSAPTLRVLS